MPISDDLKQRPALSPPSTNWVCITRRITTWRDRSIDRSQARLLFNLISWSVGGPKNSKYLMIGVASGFFVSETHLSPRLIASKQAIFSNRIRARFAVIMKWENNLCVKQVSRASAERAEVFGDKKRALFIFLAKKVRPEKENFFFLLANVFNYVQLYSKKLLRFTFLTNRTEWGRRDANTAFFVGLDGHASLVMIDRLQARWGTHRQDELRSNSRKSKQTSSGGFHKRNREK